MINSKKDKFMDKNVCYCKFCNFPISNPSFYPGKKLMVNRYCPRCHSVNSFFLLNKQDRHFLRWGFFSNPLYPLTPYLVRGVPQKITMMFYPVTILTNFVLNIIYMPLGLITNNVQISRARKVFYENADGLSVEEIYYDMLRNKAAQGISHANYLMGMAYLSGQRFPYDLSIALEYLTKAKEEYEEELVQYVKKSLLNNPKYGELLAILNLIDEHPIAAYYLAYLYYYGHGTTASLSLALTYGTIAYNARVKDSFDIYSKLELKAKAPFI